MSSPLAPAAPLDAGRRAEPRHAPGPRGRRLLGSLHDVRTDRLRFVTAATRDYGDIVCFRMGPKRLFLLRHPDHVRHVLVDNQRNYRKGLGLDEARPLLGEGLLTSEGAVWAAERRLIQTMFQQARLDDHGAALCGVLRETTARWQGFAARERVVDVAHEMTRLSMQVVATCLLSPRLMDFADDCARDLAEIGRWSMTRMTALVRLPLFVPTPANLRARAALARLERVAAALVDASRARRPDVADMIARLEAPAAGGGHVPSQRLVRDEIMTMLLAGHETTAAALSWAWHLLARHPHEMQRLQEELDERLGGRTPEPGDLPQLPYTRAVVNETMRLYPPVWLLPRRAVAADTIGGYDVPAGADVLVSLYSLHRHPAYWRDPDDFQPQRFMAGPAGDAGAMRAYLPFGAGPRSCVGMRLGLLESVLALATLAARFTPAAAGHRAPVADASLSLHPRGGVPMFIRERPGTIPERHPGGLS